MAKPPGFRPPENAVTVRKLGDAPKKEASTKGKQIQLKKKFPKLFGLRCWDMAQDKIKAGIAIEEVARWMQDDMMEYRDSKRESLIRNLYRFKGELDPEEIVTNEPNYLDEITEKMKRGVNEIDELEKLYLLQLKRIGIDAATEGKINKLFKTTNNEINLAQQLLVKRVELKAKLGLIDVAPTEFNVNQTTSNFNVNTTPIAGVPTIGQENLLGMDEERRMRLGLAAQKMLNGLMNSNESELKRVIIDQADET